MDTSTGLAGSPASLAGTYMPSAYRGNTSAPAETTTRLPQAATPSAADVQNSGASQSACASISTPDPFGSTKDFGLGCLDGLKMGGRLLQGAFMLNFLPLQLGYKLATDKEFRENVRRNTCHIAGTVGNGIAGVAKFGWAVGKGCLKQGWKIGCALYGFAKDFAEKPEVREKCWKIACKIGNGTWNLLSAAGNGLLAAGKYGLKLLSDPNVRARAWEAIKAGAAGAWKVITDPKTWKTIGRFLGEIFKDMGLKDIVMGLKDMLLNPVYFAEALVKLAQGDLKGAAELALKPLKGFVTLLNGVKTLLLDFTGLADLGRALVAFSKGDMVGAGIYFACALGGLIQTAAVVGTILTGGAAAESIVAAMGFKKLIQRGGVQLLAKSMGKELAEKLTTEAVEACGRKAAGELGEAVGEGAIRLAQKEMGSMLSREAMVVMRRELADLGKDATLEGFVRNLMTKTTEDVALKKLQQELAEMGEEAVIKCLRNMTNGAAKKITTKQVEEIATRNLLEMAEKQGLTVEGVEKLVTERIGKFGTMKFDEIVRELRALGVEGTDRELKKMARGIRGFVRGKLGRKYDERFIKELSEGIHKEMLQDIEKRNLREVFSSAIDDLGRRYGLEDDFVKRWKKIFEKSFDDFAQKYLKEVIEKGVRRAVEGMRSRRRVPMCPSYVTPEAKRSAEDITEVEMAAQANAAGRGGSFDQVIDETTGGGARRRADEAVVADARLERHKDRGMHCESFLVKDTRLDGVADEGDYHGDMVAPDVVDAQGRFAEPQSLADLRGPRRVKQDAIEDPTVGPTRARVVRRRADAEVRAGNDAPAAVSEPGTLRAVVRRGTVKKAA